MLQKEKLEAANLVDKIKVKANHTLAKTKDVLKDQSGQQLVDNAGWVAVIVVLIGVVLYASYPWLKDTLWPAVTSKIMGLLNFSGT